MSLSLFAASIGIPNGSHQVWEVVYYFFHHVHVVRCKWFVSTRSCHWSTRPCFWICWAKCLLSFFHGLMIISDELAGHRFVYNLPEVWRSMTARTSGSTLGRISFNNFWKLEASIQATSHSPTCSLYWTCLPRRFLAVRSFLTTVKFWLDRCPF